MSFVFHFSLSKHFVHNNYGITSSVLTNLITLELLVLIFLVEQLHTLHLPVVIGLPAWIFIESCVPCDKSIYHFKKFSLSISNAKIIFLFHLNILIASLFFQSFLSGCVYLYNSRQTYNNSIF